MVTRMVGRVKDSYKWVRVTMRMVSIRHWVKAAHTYSITQSTHTTKVQ